MSDTSTGDLTVGDLAKLYLNSISQGLVVGGLVWWGGSWWIWKERLWVQVDEEVVTNQVTLWADETRLFDPTRRKVADVVRALRAMTEGGWAAHPIMLGENLDPSWCVAFRDVVVDTATGETYPRDDRWFSNGHIPADWPGWDAVGGFIQVEGGLEPEEFQELCPTWVKVLMQWDDGRVLFERLLRTFTGYCLVPWRGRPRWLLKYGLPRSGKGVCSRVVELLGGGPKTGWYVGLGLDHLTSRFGLQAILHAKVVDLQEASDMRGAGSILKQMLGGDRIMVDRKWERILTNQKIQPAIMLSTNEIPAIHDPGLGLVSKGLVLHYRKSWLDREDEDLDRKLAREAAGIGMWAVAGAVDLRVRGWIKTEDQDLLNAVDSKQGLHEAFLNELFEKNPQGLVPMYLIEKMWNGWCQRHKVTGRDASTYGLAGKLADAWNLTVVRSGRKKVRSLRGLIPSLGD